MFVKNKSFQKKRDIHDKRKGLLLIIFAVICGFLAAIIVFTTGVKMLPSVSVLEAVVEIEKGTPLDRTYFKEVKLPEAGLPKGTVHPNADLSKIIVTRDMIPGDILRQEGTIELETTNPAILSSRLRVLNNPELRGVEIPIDAAKGMLWGIKAGDVIDVIAVYEQEKLAVDTDESDTIGLKSETILKGVPIIGVRKKSEDGNIAEMSLVIAITKEQVERLALYKVIGEIHVSLRPLGLVSKS